MILRIGVVGLQFTMMAANEHGVFTEARALLDRCSQTIPCRFIIWPNPVQDMAEAERAATFFKMQEIDFLLLQASSFAMGEIVIPLAALVERIGIWLVDEPTFEGELQLNSLTGFNLIVSTIRATFGSSRKIKWFRGTGADFEQRISDTVQSLSALKQLSGCRIASIGGTVPGFDNLELKGDSFASSLGIELIQIDLVELFHLAESAPQHEVSILERQLAVRSACVRVDAKSLETTARICQAIQVLKTREGLSAAALRCWPEFQDWNNIAPCAAVAWANDECMPTACEGDLPGAVAMLLGKILSGRATTMNDPVALHDGTDSIQMWHCGPGPVSWANEKGRCLDYHHTLNRRLAVGAKPAGVSSDIQFARGPVTMLRIRGDGHALFVLEGEVVDGPAPPFPGSGGWIGHLRMGGEHVSPNDIVQMMTVYGLEHHYPLMRGWHENVLREMAAWAGWSILPRLDSSNLPVA